MKFEQKVLELCCKIPKGKITTYKLLAKALGNENAFRAVGNALKKNRRPIVIPCHRVVKSNGRVGNYSLGVKKKIELLKREGINIQKGKIKNFEDVLFSFK